MRCALPATLALAGLLVAAPRATAQQPAVEDHSAHTAQDAPQAAPIDQLPPVTDADRAAAFPGDLEGHTVHDRRTTTFVLFDQLEWRGTHKSGALDNTSWVGGDVNRFWLRAEGEMEDGRVDNASLHALWGHSVSRWWDVVAGVRQDFEPEDSQTWAAVGLQGLAPYWFELQATGYLGAGGRTHARLEAEYELLLTNRLIVQPLVEVELYGKADPSRSIGAGLSSVETGLRLRYEIRRELAPYIGITWDRKFFGTADLIRAEGGDVNRARVAIGVRTWF